MRHPPVPIPSNAKSANHNPTIYAKPSALGFLYFIGRGAEIEGEVIWVYAIIIASLSMYVPVLIYNIALLPCEMHGNLNKSLEVYNQVNDISSPFVIDIDFSGVDRDKVEKINDDCIMGSIDIDHDVCRIKVLNISPNPIAGCRLVLEKISPRIGLKDGNLLIEEHVYKKYEGDFLFNLSSGETKYFKFIRFESGVLGIIDHGFCVITSEIGFGTMRFLTKKPQLNTGIVYNAEILIHGREVRSQRMNLSISADTSYELKIEKTI